MSDCGSESYGVTEFINWHLNPLSNKHTSHIKDTYQFLEKVKEIRVGFQASFFSLDVESLYTNIETERGLAAVEACLKKYPQEGRLDGGLLRLLELSLTRNHPHFLHLISSHH